MRALLHRVWLHGLAAPRRTRYEVGIAAAILASAFRISLNPWWGTSFPYIFFFPTTFFTALFAGLGPAVLGIAISGAATAMWILPPIGSLAVSNELNLSGLVVYVLVDGLIGWIGAQHRALIRTSEEQRRLLAAREAALE